MAKREGRRDYFMVAPEDLKIQRDPNGKFYDVREKLPLVEETVLNIMAFGVRETIIAVPFEDEDYVVSGRQRTKHAIEANRRLKANGEEPIKVPVIFARDGENIPLLEVSLNEHRQDDSALVRIDKAIALREAGKYSDEQIAASFRIGVPQLKNWYKADELCAPVKKAIEAGKISVSAASKFAKMEPAEQVDALESLIESGVKPTIKNAAHAVKGESPEKKAFTRKRLNAMRDSADTPPAFGDFIAIILGEMQIEDSEELKDADWLK